MWKIFVRHTITVICMLFALQAEANMQFRHFTVDDGLSSNAVFSIVQDSTGFVWAGTREGLSRFDGKHFKTYYSFMRPLGLGNDYINALYVDQRNLLWVGTGAGCYVYNSKTDSFQKFDVKTAGGAVVSGSVDFIDGHGDYVYMLTQGYNGIFRYNIKTGALENLFNKGFPSAYAISFGSNGRIWISFIGLGLYYTDNGFKTVQMFRDHEGRNPFHDMTVTTIVPTEQNSIFVSTSTKGLYSVDLGTGIVSRLTAGLDAKAQVVHRMARYGNELWMATEHGLVIYKMLNREVANYHYEDTDPFSINDNSLQCVYRDRQGGVWIGSYFGGINYTSPSQDVFQKYFPRPDKPYSLRGRRVRNMVEAADGTIWVGTEDQGLSAYVPREGRFYHIDESYGWSNIHALCVVGKELWVGAYGNGVKVLDIASRKVVRSFTADKTPGSLGENGVFCIRHIGSKVYLGLFNGLSVYDMRTGKFTPDTSLPQNLIYDILRDRKGRLWVAYYGNGIYMKKSEGSPWVHFSSGDAKHTVASDIVLSLFEDCSGRIWATSQGMGVQRYDERSQSFVPEPIPKVSPVLMVYSMVEDDHNTLWLTTNSGLMRYNPVMRSVQLFKKDNRLLANDFNYNSALLASDGTVYMGSSSGFMSFDPDQIEDTKQKPVIVATDFLIDNEEVNNRLHNSPLSESITFTHAVTLAHDQGSFSIRMAVLDFRNIERRQLVYKLEGFDNQWQNLGEDGFIKYTNLSPGHYRLKVKLASLDNDSASPEYDLDITIMAPFYLRWWAFALYLLFAVAIGYVTWRKATQRYRAKRQMAMEHFKHEKEQQLYQSKINFFTRVAHEVRTPLTLIKEPLGELMKKEGTLSDEKDNLDIMNRNVSRLLDLVNQLLDFRKAEQEGVQLNFERCDISQLVNDVYVRFRPTMHGKHIRERLMLPAEPVYGYVDREAFTKIVSNLMTNAVKYCERFVEVSLAVSGSTIVLTTRNDGPLVDASLREKIFAPFMRGDVMPSKTGTGIGLALARSLAELHEGTLGMEDDPELNVFRLALPITHKALAMKPVPTEAASQVEDAVLPVLPVDDSQPTVLIVEDDPELLAYERSRIRKHYNVLTATTGEEALEVLAGKTVSLIISDVVMQPMDGFELCKRIKNDINISHVPVILLTALTLDSAKIKGMESGADAYVEKPFSMDYLLSVVQNLLRQREQAKKAFVSSPFTTSNTITASKAEKEFVERLEKIVNENIADSDFNIDRLASLMCMSRTNMNRKIQADTGLTPNNYIKVARLKRAAQLLKEGKTRINEVCYDVGFTSPSYFTQCFSKQFGLSPKEFISK